MQAVASAEGVQRPHRDGDRSALRTERPVHSFHLDGPHPQDLRTLVSIRMTTISTSKLHFV